MEENKVIEYIRSKFPYKNGIGDDAAIIANNHVISKDLLIEDIHFRTKYFDPKSLAHKSLHVNLSDMAAMNAKPLYIMLGISFPKNNDAYIQIFIEEFCKVCHKNNVIIIGGDTTSSSDKISISITIIGMSDNPVKRSTANIGDDIYVIGELGYAHLGLEALENGIEGLEIFKESFLRPKAKLKEALCLVSELEVTAMMDVSDGLVIDLKKLCLSSGVAARINISELEYIKDFQLACEKLSLDPLSVALMGGEDYGLLVTMKPDAYKDFDAFNLKKIGKIIAGKKGLVLYDKAIDISVKMFSHFGEL